METPITFSWSRSARWREAAAGLSYPGGDERLWAGRVRRLKRFAHLICFLGFGACTQVGASPATATRAVETKEAGVRRVEGSDLTAPAGTSVQSAAAKGESPPTTIHELPVDSGPGVFRERLRIEPPSDHADPCPPVLNDLLVVPDGQAWAVGGCGIRVLLTSTGVQDMSAKSVAKLHPVSRSECRAYPRYLSLVGWSKNAVLAVGPVTCGMDPSAVWPADGAFYDGSGWQPRAISWPLLPDVEGGPNRLIGLTNGHQVSVRFSGYGMTGGCFVHEKGQGGWQELFACAADESIRSVVPRRDGGLTVLVERLDVATGEQRSFLKTWDGKTWHQRVVPVSQIVAISPKGRACVAGDALYCEAGDGFEEVTPIPSASRLADLHVVSDKDVWFLIQGEPVHFDGQEFARVPVVSEPSMSVSLDGIRASSNSIWAFSLLGVWQYVRHDAPPPPEPVVLQVPAAR